MKNSQKLIILDRDGVVNFDSDKYIKSIEEWQPIPGSISAICKLKAAGYLIAVATNQSGIARDYFNLNTLADMHEKFKLLLLESGVIVDAIMFCPHGPNDGCDCRKPKAGLLNRISQHFALPLNGVYVIGDSLRDLEAGDIVGAQPILVRTGKGEKTYQKLTNKHQYPVYDDLLQVSRAILAQQV